MQVRKIRLSLPPGEIRQRANVRREVFANVPVRSVPYRPSNETTEEKIQAYGMEPKSILIDRNKFYIGSTLHRRLYRNV